MKQPNRALITIKRLRIKQEKGFPLWGSSESNGYVWIIPNSDLWKVEQYANETGKLLEELNQ